MTLHDQHYSLSTSTNSSSHDFSDPASMLTALNVDFMRYITCLTGLLGSGQWYLYKYSQVQPTYLIILINYACSCLVLQGPTVRECVCASVCTANAVWGQMFSQSSMLQSHRTDVSTGMIESVDAVQSLAVRAAAPHHACPTSAARRTG